MRKVFGSASSRRHASLLGRIRCNKEPVGRPRQSGRACCLSQGPRRTLCERSGRPSEHGAHAWRIVEFRDNTLVCTKQFCSYRDNADGFASLSATVVGISSQSLESHQSFIAKNSLNVPLLADVDKAVAKAYGAHSLLGTKRAVIVIDEQGMVRNRHDHRLGLDYQSVDDLKAALDSLPSPAA
jgi:thioredoxin-dependent peroxiredoxin